MKAFTPLQDHNILTEYSSIKIIKFIKV